MDLYEWEHNAEIKPGAGQVAWHFLPEDRRMRWGKWRNPVREGVTYVTRKPLVLCESGLHASIRAREAQRT